MMVKLGRSQRRTEAADQRQRNSFDRKTMQNFGDA